MLLRVRNKHIISRLLIVKLTLAFGLLTLYPLEADGKRNTELRELLQQLETGDGKYRLQKSPNRYYQGRASIAAKAEFKDLAHQMRTGGAKYKHIPNSWVGGSRYSRKDETYAKPRYRTTPDSNPYTNDSYYGNYKPNTGTITPRNSQKSPNRYYQGRASRAAKAEFKDLAHQMRTGGAKYKHIPNSWVGGSRYSRKDQTYVKPRYRTATGSRSDNNDSSPGNFNPNLGPISTSTPWKAPNTCDKQRNPRSSPVGIDEYLKEIENQLQRDRAKMYGYPHKDRTDANPHYRTTPDSTPKKSPYTHYSQPSTDLRELLRQLESGGAQYRKK